MKAHELARRPLDGPDVPVIMAKGEMGDREELSWVTPWACGDQWDHWWDDAFTNRTDDAVELS